MLLEKLKIQPNDVIAVVGAGGKTSLCWRLVQEAKAKHWRTVFTTTTKIWQPQPSVFDVLLVGERSDVSNGLLANNWTTACVAHNIEGDVNTASINGSFMPVVQTKLIGFAPEQICVFQEMLQSQASTLFVIEADGAKGMRIKAPNANEPQIPACATTVCVVCSLDALGRPLDERIAHRVDTVAALTQTYPSSIITPPLIVSLLSHPHGGIKGIPPTAKKVAVLTQQAEGSVHPDAAFIMQELVRSGFDKAITLSLRSDEPLLT